MASYSGKDLQYFIDEEMKKLGYADEKDYFSKLNTIGALPNAWERQDYKDLWAQRTQAIQAANRAANDADWKVISDKYGISRQEWEDFQKTQGDTDRVTLGGDFGGYNQYHVTNAINSRLTPEQQAKYQQAQSRLEANRDYYNQRIAEGKFNESDNWGGFGSKEAMDAYWNGHNMRLWNSDIQNALYQQALQYDPRQLDKYYDLAAKNIDSYWQEYQPRSMFGGIFNGGASGFINNLGDLMKGSLSSTVLPGSNMLADVNLSDPQQWAFDKWKNQGLPIVAGAAATGGASALGASPVAAGAAGGATAGATANTAQGGSIDEGLGKAATGAAIGAATAGIYDSILGDSSAANAGTGNVVTPQGENDLTVSFNDGSNIGAEYTPVTDNSTTLNSIYNDNSIPNIQTPTDLGVDYTSTHGYTDLGVNGYPTSTDVVGPPVDLSTPNVSNITGSINQPADYTNIGNDYTSQVGNNATLPTDAVTGTGPTSFHPDEDLSSVLSNTGNTQLPSDTSYNNPSAGLYDGAGSQPNLDITYDADGNVVNTPTTGGGTGAGAVGTGSAGGSAVGAGAAGTAGLLSLNNLAGLGLLYGAIQGNKSAQETAAASQAQASNIYGAITSNNDYYNKLLRQSYDNPMGYLGSAEGQALSRNAYNSTMNQASAAGLRLNPVQTQMSLNDALFKNSDTYRNTLNRQRMDYSGALNANKQATDAANYANQTQTGLYGTAANVLGNTDWSKLGNSISSGADSLSNWFSQSNNSQGGI